MTSNDLTIAVRSLVAAGLALRDTAEHLGVHERVVANVCLCQVTELELHEDRTRALAAFDRLGDSCGQGLEAHGRCVDRFELIRLIHRRSGAAIFFVTREHAQR
jgi:hypothetical protein